MRVAIRLGVYLGALRLCGQPAPSPAEQDALTAKIRATALRFRGQLPDFAATETETRWEGSGAKPKKRDTLEMAIHFDSQGHTGIKLLTIDGKPTVKQYMRIGGIIDPDFLGGAILPIALFSELAKPKFEWQRWDQLGGRRVAVFAYQAEPVVKTFPKGKKGYPIGFHGVVFADSSDGMPLRIEAHVDSAPDYPFAGSGWDADFAVVNISGRELVLPVRATDHFAAGRNELTFKDYRKYQADSTVTFDQ